MKPGTNMKKPLLSNVLWIICALAFCGALSSIALAAVKKDARVTQVIRRAFAHRKVCREARIG